MSITHLPKIVLDVSQNQKVTRYLLIPRIHLPIHSSPTKMGQKSNMNDLVSSNDLVATKNDSSLSNSANIRYSSIDLLKGFGIFYMMFMHAIIHSIFQSERSLAPLMINSLSPIGLTILAPFVLLSLWGPMFSLLTAVKSTLKMISVAEHNPSVMKKTLFQRIRSSLLLIIIYRISRWMLTFQIFSPMGIEIGKFSLLYEMDTLDAIALGGIGGCFIIYILYSTKQLQFHNRLRIYVKVSTVVCFGILLFSDYVRYSVHELLPILNENNLNIIEYLLAKFGTGRFQIFPGLAYILFGINVGIILGRKSQFKNLISYILFFSIFNFSGFLIQIISNPALIEQVAEEEFPLAFHHLNLSIIPVVLLMTLYFQDILTPRLNSRKIGNYFKRFGKISLTVYMLENPFDKWMYGMYSNIFQDSIIYSTSGIPSINWTLGICVLYIAIITGFWSVWMKLSAKMNYKLSVEYLLKIIFKKKSIHKRMEPGHAK